MALAGLMLLPSCKGSKDNNLSGAGATFPEPYYKMIFKKFTEQTKADVSYGAIGSGGGYRSLKDRTVDFGASDVFLSEEEMNALPAPAIHIPTTMGAVVLSFNIDGVDSLKLDSDLISGIFLGTIKTWDDPAIAKENADVKLPSTPITVVYRSDGSGSTAVFSQYMSKVNAEWKDKIGEGKSLNFPVGVSAKGNAGVAGLIAETKGAIGYIGSEYAMAMNLKMAQLKNKSGRFISVNTKSISAAANVNMPEDTRTFITDSDNPDAYPISTLTWILVYKEQKYDGRSIDKAKSLKALLQFILSDESQALAPQINYAPLSGVALEKARKAVENMTYDGKKL